MERTAEQVEAEAKVRIDMEAAAIRAALARFGKEIAPRLAAINEAARAAQKAWAATPPEAREAMAPFLVDPWARAAAGVAAGGNAVAAAVEAAAIDDRVAEARDFEARQRVFETEQAKRNKERQPEQDRIMGVETYWRGFVSPTIRTYNGE